VKDNFFTKIAALGATPDLMTSNASRTVAVVHSRFGGYAGNSPPIRTHRLVCALAAAEG
jgi:hypothetical protein